MLDDQTFYKVEGITDTPEPCVMVGGSKLRQHDWIPHNLSFAHPKAQAENFLENGYVPLKDGFRKRACVDCDACMPVRIDLKMFDENITNSKKLVAERKHTVRNNADLDTIFTNQLPPLGMLDDDGKLCLSPHLALLNRYTAARFPMKEKFDAAAEINGLNFAGLDPVRIDLVAPQNFLAGVSIAHVADTSAYATMIFYDPALTKQAMGLYLMLETIRVLRDEGVEYLYLAEWSRVPSRLSWKDKLTPFEILIDGKWVAYDHMEVRDLRDQRSRAYPEARP